MSGQICKRGVRGVPRLYDWSGHPTTSLSLSTGGLRLEAVTHAKAGLAAGQCAYAEAVAAGARY
jgi:hypothetical protein